MKFNRCKFHRLYCSLFKSGYDIEYAAIIAYWIKNKKPISENYMNRVRMTPIINNNIIIFDDKQLDYFDKILIKLKKQDYSK